MSHKATYWAFHQRLKPIPKLVLLYLADAHNSQTGRCFPAVGTIAEECLISLTAVYKYLVVLEDEMELVSRTPRRFQGRQTSNEYTLHFDKFIDEAASVRRNTASVRRTPINQGNLTKEVNTPSEHLNKPAGLMKSKRKLFPVGPDPYACLTPEASTKSESKPVQISKTVAPIVERWNEVAVRHGPTTKSLRKGVRAVKAVLAGTFFDDKSIYQDRIRLYSQSEVLRSLDTFNLTRNNPDYLPTNKKFLKALGLADFFYSPHARNGSVNGGGSIFLQCLEKEVVPASENHPVLTVYLLDKYEDITGKVLAREGAGRVANKMMKYWGERDGWLKQWGVATPKRLVVTWFGMLEARRGGDWDVGNLLSQNAVGAFESYLKERGR